jgi:hypothetical protein
MPVIPASQIVVGGQPGQKLSEIPISTTSWVVVCASNPSYEEANGRIMAPGYAPGKDA